MPAVGEIMTAVIKKAPLARKGGLPFWEARRVYLPLPVCAELERRYGKVRSQNNSGKDWFRGANAMMDAIINFLHLPAEHLRHCTVILPDAFLIPRWKAMKDHFALYGDRAGAVRATLVGNDKLPPVGILGFTDEISELCARMRVMGYCDAMGWARHFLDQLPQEDAHKRRNTTTERTADGFVLRLTEPEEVPLE